MATVQIREARETDAVAMTRLIAEANPNMVVTPASWIHRCRTEPERARALRLVAEVEGEVVGRAQAGLNAHTTAARAAYGGVIVDPTHRRRGIGGALLERLESHLGELGAATWTTMIFENDEGVAFARRHGFRDERSAVASAVDPRTVELPLPADVELVPAGELGPEAVFEIDSAGGLDEPLPNPPAPMPFDEWRSELWDEPSFTRDGSFAAVADGTPAAIALLYVAPELGRAANAFTATLPQFRGRGLALAAKIATMRWAAANGIARVSTANDDTNSPMLAINARLGYKPLGRLLTMRRDL
ncbi:MAG TPA: GNAT family N-acetyltransferase [Gaiellaceae bacterium]